MTSHRFIRGVGAVLLIGCGCVMPEGTGALDAARQVNTTDTAPSRYAAIFASDGLGAVLDVARAEMRQRVPNDELSSALYLDYRDVPYQRARLALGLKMQSVLEREQGLREQRRGAYSDTALASMVQWMDRAIHGPLRDDGAVHRVDDAELFLGRGDVGTPSICTAEWNSGAALPCVPVVTFIDRATATRRDRWLGDVDVMVSGGFGAYASPRLALLAVADRRALETFLTALDLPVTAWSDDGPTSAERSPFGDTATHPLHASTLRDLLQVGTRTAGPVVVIDPPKGERFIGLLARRALGRGATGSGTVAATGTVQRLLGGRSNVAAVRAELWARALDGERLTLLEGWRDRRDGTLTPYDSAWHTPGLLEAAAYASVDFARTAPLWRYFPASRQIAFLVSAEHLNDGTANQFDERLLDWLEAFRAAQLPFDLVPDGPEVQVTHTSRYALVIRCPDDLSAAEETDVWTSGRTETWALPRDADGHPDWAAVAQRAVERLTATNATGRRCRVEHLDGTPVGGIFVMPTADLAGVGMVNLQGVTRQVRLRWLEGAPPAKLKDWLHAEDVSNDVITLGPYTCRILIAKR